MNFNDFAITPTRALELVTSLRKASHYADDVLRVRRQVFDGAPDDDRERVVLCDPRVQHEVRMLFPETGRGYCNRIRLSMPKEGITSENIDDVKVEIFLAVDDGNFLRCETFSLTSLPYFLSLAVKAELFHCVTGAYRRQSH